MKEILAQLFFCLLGLFAVYAMAYTVRWHWRKWRWGCRRCTYRKTILTLNGYRTLCTASCGNNRGEVCGAWFYEDPKKKEDDDE